MSQSLRDAFAHADAHLNPSRLVFAHLCLPRVILRTVTTELSPQRSSATSVSTKRFQPATFASHLSLDASSNDAEADTFEFCLSQCATTWAFRHAQRSVVIHAQPSLPQPYLTSP